MYHHRKYSELQVSASYSKKFKAGACPRLQIIGIWESGGQVKRRVKIPLIVAWLIFATIALAYMWGNNPDAFPRPPESVSIFLLRLDGSQLAQAEIHYLFIVSFIVISVFTFLALFVCVKTREILGRLLAYGKVIVK